MTLRRFLSGMLASVALCAPSLLLAQSHDGVEKVELFGGYSWYRAGGSLPSTDVNRQATPAETVPDFRDGGAAQFTYNVNSWAGITLDGAGHVNDFGHTYSIAAGPQFRLRGRHLSAFGEALFGTQSFAPKQFPEQNAASFLVGGGIDIRVNPRLSIRPLQADYVTSYYTKLSPPSTNNAFSGTRLQAGLVLNFGYPKPAAEHVMAACMAEPEAVDAGVPVMVTVTPEGFSPTRKLSYSYESNGGKVSGKGSTASVDTKGLNPGRYTVSAMVVSEGEHRRATGCQASFLVNGLPKHAPTLSISADPTSVTVGDISTITANGSSADSRPLSYECGASGGRLSGNGPRFTLETEGVAETTIVVNCTVSDDRNLTASANARVQVHAKVAAAAPMAMAPVSAKKYGSIGFQRDAKRPTRVDNEAKGELDRYADALAVAPDAKGVVVGSATVKEGVKGDKAARGSRNFAAQRAVNTKDYLTKERGVDPARIDVRSGGSGQRVELWFVPAGATFQPTDTTAVDEAKVKAVPRVGRKTKKAVHRKVAPREP